MEDQEKQKFEELRKEIQVGIKQLDAGQGIPLDVAREETRRRRESK